MYLSINIPSEYKCLGNFVSFFFFLFLYMYILNVLFHISVCRGYLDLASWAWSSTILRVPGRWSGVRGYQPCPVVFVYMTWPARGDFACFIPVWLNPSMHLSDGQYLAWYDLGCCEGVKQQQQRQNFVQIHFPLHWCSATIILLYQCKAYCRSNT